MIGKKGFSLSQGMCSNCNVIRINPCCFCETRVLFYDVHAILYIDNQYDTLLALPERGQFFGCSANADGQSKNLKRLR
jgi:hypothetical protein